MSGWEAGTGTPANCWPLAPARLGTAIGEALVVSARAVEKHIASIFTKLDLPPDSGQYHRRVMAVVRYLNS